jgi:hypothetical protein
VRKKIWDGLQAGLDPSDLSKLAGPNPLIPDTSLDAVPVTEAAGVAAPSEGDVAEPLGGEV